MSKKIGIITFHYAPNYGAVLQAYGLVDYLTRAGHDVEVIDYRTPVAKRYMLRAMVRRRWNLSAMWHDYTRCRQFIRFLRQHLKPSSYTATTGEQLGRFSDKYDVVITGSDQVWNTKTFGYFPAYFLEFCDPTKCTLASYAPSAGATETWGQHAGLIRTLLDRFHHLSCRDLHTAELVRNTTGGDSTLVLDPTYLGDFEHLIELPPTGTAPYMLLYHVQRDPVLDRSIKKLKRKLGLRVVAIGNPSDAADETRVVVSPEQWLGYVKQAELVVTNSFHGTIFSMQFERPVFVLPHPTGTMRLQDLLDRAGVPERLLADDTAVDSISDDSLAVDFAGIRAKLAPQVERSRKFLDTAVGDAL